MKPTSAPATGWLSTRSGSTTFARATGDLQWIHIDPERAATGPFGGTIAHGYLTLSLIPFLTATLLDVHHAALVVNYGLDRVRFIQPVRVGSFVRASGVITAVESASLGIRVSTRVTVEIQGSDKPAVIADTISLFVPETA